MKGSRHETLIEALEKLSREVIAPMGLELVELTLRGPSSRRVLRVDIDRAGPRGIDVDDCQRVSGALADALDGPELLDDSFVLEVSSPGVDRPIVSPDDFRRNTGRRIVVVTHGPVEGRTRFTGLLTGCGTDGIHLEDDEAGSLRIDIRMIASARQEVGL